MFGADRASNGSAGVARKQRRPKAEADFAGILARYRGTVRRTTCALIVLRLVPVAIPIMLRFTLDPLLDRRSTVLFGIDWTPEALLWFVVVAACLVAIIRASANYWSVALSGRCGHQLVADLRVKMVEHILRLPVHYVDRRGTGRILLRFMGDSDALRIWFSRTAPAVFADRILVVVLIGVMLWIHWKLALLVLAPLPVLYLATARMVPRLRDLTLHSRRLQAIFTGHVETRISWIRQAKWLDANRNNRVPTREFAEEIGARNASRDRQAAMVNGTGQLLAHLSIPILIAWGVHLVWDGGISIGNYIAFAWLAAHVNVSVHRLAAAVVVRQKARVSRERILRLLERKAERGRSSRLPRFRAKGRSLHCRGLVFTHAGRGCMENPLDLELKGPGVHLLPSNIDARAFLEVVLGFSREEVGGIELDGQSLKQVDIISLRKAIGWVPARVFLFEGTLLDNILAASLNREDEGQLARIMPVLAMAVDHPTEWLAREAGPNGVHVDPDSRLLIGLLRAVIRKPKFVFVEQLSPTSELAPVVQRTLASLAETALVVVTAHDSPPAVPAGRMTARYSAAERN